MYDHCEAGAHITPFVHGHLELEKYFAVRPVHRYTVKLLRGSTMRAKERVSM